ncbi:MAG: PqqD family protein [Planctomycetes bacterium]|nr:PqqD family protein [Planctomycetota bacterium]
MFFRRKGVTLSREESLQAIPAHNPAVKANRDDGGIVRLAIPRRKVWWVNLLAKIVYVPDERRIVLDEIGSEVWAMCDGRLTVRGMIDKFSQKYKLNRKEAEVSMVTYLKQLAQKGIILVEVPSRMSAQGKSAKGGKRK